MLRKIICIDESRCNGCGLCARACHEGAIDIVNGKARLMREHFCDGLGDCLPACPMNAISFEMREAPGYDEQAVLEAKRKKEAQKASPVVEGDAPNALNNWPVQLFLVGAASPVFHGCDLLVAADCTAYAYGNFHRDFLAGRSCVIACPKQREHDQAEKLAAIFRENDIRSVTLARMFVPCCGGLEYAVYQALAVCGKEIPLRIVTIGADGKILKTEG